MNTFITIVVACGQYPASSTLSYLYQMDYNFSEIEKKWLDNWAKTNLYKVEEDPAKEKYYVLDMFPYPSGSGLHVGHPLGYVASDIVSRYKRLKGFNVLHPMGFDAFGLPAEQYAIETGTHPRTTTLKNIDYFRSQLMRMGFSYDWSREVMTCDPKFYKWTQWIFMQLFNSWYDPFLNKAQPIETLINLIENEGSNTLFNLDKAEKNISADDWKNFSEKEKQQYLMHFRLAYLDFAEVWWCEALGTVLANDEVKDGVSERGGHPVERMKLRQWFLRITEYADRLLQGLDTLDWSDAMKEMQRNWIGKSEGALVKFQIGGTSPFEGGKGGDIEIFTTRPDTIFGATFMVLAPEHALVEKITTAEYKNEVEKYLSYVKSRSERDRMTEVKKVTGQFTGAYAINPFTEKQIPVYIAEYVLAGYGTGAIMAVPSNDDRDHTFAEKFNIEIIPVVDQSKYPNAEREDKIGIMTNSGLLNGMEVKDAIKTILDEIEKRNIGKRKINYRLRDAGFSRQRYWGEPFPVYYVDDMPYLIPENELPVLLPEVNSYKPVGGAKAPLSALTEWTKYKNGTREVDTMPGYAGSSWYLYRYMDVNNENEFASKEKINYWKNVDLYIGGAEHAVGHLLYSRMWNHFLYDLDLVVEKEPFKKLVNQGMIQGKTGYIYRLTLRKIKDFKYEDSLQTNVFVSFKLYEKYRNHKITQDELMHEIRLQVNDDSIGTFLSNELSVYNGSAEFKGNDYNNEERTEFEFIPIAITINRIDDDIVDTESLRDWRSDMKNATFITEEGKFYCLRVPEKMSKRYFNTTDPIDVMNEYGADCFRLYEMFLGPLDASKPWDTKGITGVSSFLRKVWRLFYENDILKITDEAPTKQELKILHKTIKKVGEDIERMNFNTAVSSLMICVNELLEIKCNKKEILKDLLILLAPLAPFITEELWLKIGNEGSIHTADWPGFNEDHLIENTFNYPIQVNGKLRDNVELPLDMPKEEVEKQVLALESILKWTEGKTPKKVVVVPGKIVNVVV